jgi:hypothetical protein
VINDYFNHAYFILINEGRERPFGMGFGRFLIPALKPRAMENG